jgi:hypothetical protein
VRVFLGEALNGSRCATVRVAFAQHRVYGAAKRLAVTPMRLAFLVGRRIVGVVRQGKALRLQLGDGCFELRNRSADIGQLDDVGVRVLRQVAEFAEIIRDLLIRFEAIGKLSQDPRGHGDVGLGDLDARRSGECSNDRQQGVGCEQWRFVGKCIKDVCCISAHHSVPLL